MTRTQRIVGGTKSGGEVCSDREILEEKVREGVKRAMGCARMGVEIRDRL